MSWQLLVCSGSIATKDEVYELMVEDFPILKEILETPKQEVENEQ